MEPFRYQLGDAVANVYNEDVGEVIYREHGEITGEPQYKVGYHDHLGPWVVWYYEDALSPV